MMKTKLLIAGLVLLFAFALSSCAYYGDYGYYDYPYDYGYYGYPYGFHFHDRDGFRHFDGDHHEFHEHDGGRGR